jgi:hypothetical protein
MFSLNLIEHHPQRVLEAFRRGEFDQIEIIGQADEKEFFELCFKEKLLPALAKEMPTARKQDERATPCDQDTLRKFTRDVTAQRWMDWFNGPVQREFQAYGFFDTAGIFVGDGSYLFVPDNPAYEGPVEMWFDEHNHPVEYDKLTADQRKKAHRERCYKLVSLLHLRGDCYVCAALAVVPGNAHECPVLYQLVEQWVRQVGRGVIKLPILDRGFIDGKNISRCKQEWGIDVLLPMKKRMDIWEDAWALGQQCPWQPLRPAPPQSKVPPSHRPEVIVRREIKRQKTLAAKKAKNRHPIRPRCWWARRSARSEALPVGPNAPCPSTSYCCATHTPMATRTNGP